MKNTQDQFDAIAAELDALKISSKNIAIGFCRAEARYLRRIAQLEAAFERYGVHESTCPIRRRGPIAELECSCGFDQIIRSTETPEGLHARVVTETADAIARERGLSEETKDEP